MSQRNLDYESIDRYMSSWVVACLRGDVLIMLTDDGLGTDMPKHARVFCSESLARDVANAASLEPGWNGFAWEPMRVPEAIVYDAKP